MIYGGRSSDRPPSSARARRAATRQRRADDKDRRSPATKRRPDRRARGIRWSDSRHPPGAGASREAGSSGAEQVAGQPSEKPKPNVLFGHLLQVRNSRREDGNARAIVTFDAVEKPGGQRGVFLIAELLVHLIEILRRVIDSPDVNWTFVGIRSLLPLDDAMTVMGAGRSRRSGEP